MVCDGKCDGCKAWTMCGISKPVRRRFEPEWYAGFLTDGRQVTPAYKRHEMPEKAKDAALDWGMTVSIKPTWTDKYALPPMPDLGVDPDSGRTVTYVVDGQNVTVETQWFVMPTGYCDVIGPLVKKSGDYTKQLLNAAATADGKQKAVMYGGKFAASRCWSFHSPVSSQVAKKSLDHYRETGLLDLAAIAITNQGVW